MTRKHLLMLGGAYLAIGAARLGYELTLDSRAADRRAAWGPKDYAESLLFWPYYLFSGT